MSTSTTHWSIFPSKARHRAKSLPSAQPGAGLFPPHLETRTTRVFGLQKTFKVIDSNCYLTLPSDLTTASWMLPMTRGDEPVLVPWAVLLSVFTRGAF